MSEIKKLSEQNDVDALKEKFSMHCIKNEWHDIQFFDVEGGIHKSSPPELLHVLQHGLHEYLIKGMFGEKRILKNGNKKKKNNKSVKKQNQSNDDTFGDNVEESEIFEEVGIDEIDIALEDYEENLYDPNDMDVGGTRIFTDTYTARFETICGTFGKRLARQSDREMPRTNFFTTYSTITRKNGHEMAGLLIVYLMVLLSHEHEKLEIFFGESRWSAFIHVIELMLMLEEFCKTLEHSKSDVKKFAKGLPLLMQTYANTINRKVGDGMKIIKFHLPMHFVDVLFNFGSMDNTNSARGEMFHKSETKDPSQTTQRRKDNFELQTAWRYVENLIIAVGNKDTRISETEDEKMEQQYKRKIVFNILEKKFQKKGRDHKYVDVNWEDKVLTNALLEIFEGLIDKQCILRKDINLFTQVNYKNTIFRGDPSFDLNRPWYDWAFVDWGGNQSIIPCKILLFVDLRNAFLKKFKVGSSQISEPGIYAFGTSIDINTFKEAYGISKLVSMGDLLLNEDEQLEFCMFPVESI